MCRLCSTEHSPGSLCNQWPKQMDKIPTVLIFKNGLTFIMKQCKNVIFTQVCRATPPQLYFLKIKKPPTARLMKYLWLSLAISANERHKYGKLLNTHSYKLFAPAKNTLFSIYSFCYAMKICDSIKNIFSDDIHWPIASTARKVSLYSLWTKI